MADGTENGVSGDQELLQAMEELERVQQRVAQLREQTRQKAIAEITEKIKLYDLRPEELGFPKSQVTGKASRKPGQQDALPQSSSVGAAAMAPESMSIGVDRRSQVRPKYQSPDGTHTWSGRGKPPQWMKELLDGGASKEDFEIEECLSGTAE